MQTQVYSIDEIREIVAPIAKQHGVDKVFLFGSYARGDATPASDVDLCVDAPKLRGLFALGGLYADLEDALKKSIDVVTTGSLKYNKDKAFLENLLESFPMRMCKKPSRRWIGAQSKICAICSRTTMVQWTKIASGRRQPKMFRHLRRIANAH